MTASIHDRAVHSEARELCLALAKICEALRQWDGARTLRRAAEYLYHQKFQELFRAERQAEKKAKAR